MLNPGRIVMVPQQGVTLLEVLVTILILAFGMLGLAGLMGKTQIAEMESYQRVQAVSLLSEMTERIEANRIAATAYVTGTASPLGVGDTQPATCAGIPFGAAHDQCEWSNALKGAAELKSGLYAGAMLGARGCIERVQAADPTPGVCRPGIYRVTVAWQGLNPTAAPFLACGSGLYGATNLRRAIAADVTVGLPGC